MIANMDDEFARQALRLGLQAIERAFELRVPGGLGFGDRSGGDMHGHALAQKRQGYAPPNPPAGAGDECYGSFHDISSPSL